MIYPENQVATTENTNGDGPEIIIDKQELLNRMVIAAIGGVTSAYATKLALEDK